MHADDIPEIVEIERESFAVMWPAGAYRERNTIEPHGAVFGVTLSSGAPAKS